MAQYSSHSYSTHRAMGWDKDEERGMDEKRGDRQKGLTKHLIYLKLLVKGVQCDPQTFTSNQGYVSSELLCRFR